MRAEAERIWPQVRRRPMRRGATGIQVARTTVKTIRATIAAITSSVSAGLRSSRTRPFDPFSTPLQKRSVALVPNTPPDGTA